MNFLHRLHKDHPRRVSFAAFLLRLIVAVALVLGGAWLVIHGLVSD